MTTNTKFYIGQELSDRSIGDHNCIFRATVISRTAKFVTLDTDIAGIKRVGIKSGTRGVEFCYPYGTYSMAASFHADEPKIPEVPHFTEQPVVEEVVVERDEWADFLSVGTF